MKTQETPWEVTQRRNTRHLFYWTLAWLLSIALVSFGPGALWNRQPGIAVILIMINILIGTGMIVMNRKYFHGLDELNRKITMDAMAVALGVSVVGGIGYSLLELTQVIDFEAEIAHLVLLMGISYLVGITVGYKRYQ